MESEEIAKSSPEQPLTYGDYVLILVSHALPGTNPDEHNISAYLSQVRQIHSEGGSVILEDPQENINRYPRTGSTLGYVDRSMLVIPTKIDTSELPDNSGFKPEKDGQVLIKIGENHEISYLASAIYDKYNDDMDAHLVRVENGQGLKRRIQVLGKYIFPSKLKKS